jgi:predicted extracellular nuclease
VFISEIHYDNDGTDTGEAIEVQAPIGTDLTGWSLVLYNAATGALYDTDPVGGVVPAAGVVVVNYPSNGIQNGSPDGVALVGADGSLVEFLSYEGTFIAAGGPAAGRTSTDIGVSEPGTTPIGQSLQRISGTWTGPAVNSFGVLNGAVEPPGDTCGDPNQAVALISDIQGSGDQFDPDCAGEQLVEAVVTAIKPGLDGVYLQEEAGDDDGDPTSSEGIFVHTSSTMPSVAVGDAVRVTGTVAEYTGGGSQQTQLTNATFVVTGEGTPISVTTVRFPVETTTYLESVEGMLVNLSDTLVISEYFNYDRFGEVVLGMPREGETRLHTPTAVVEPGALAQELAELYSRSIITLDDANSSQNPDVIPHPGNGEAFSATNTFRGGDTVTGVVGVIDDTFGKYRIQPTTYGTYAAKNARPDGAPDVGGTIQVASYNVLNYFLTLDDGKNDICGANQRQECRGADSAEEFDRQRTKILNALSTLDAEVVGLMEMENTPGVEPAADLVAGLNEMLGARVYDYIDTGILGTDAIRVGLLYKRTAVKPVDDFAILDSSIDPRFDSGANRPMLTQTFVEVGTGGRFTVSVNHLKSKGSACKGDPDTGDGQGNCNLTRTAAAAAIVDFLASDPTGTDEPDHLVIGDLNSYDMEDPIDVLVGAGYTDQVKVDGGEFAYGYVFDGMAGYLDHALSNASLSSQVTGAREWHINADEPDILDYNLDFGRSEDYFTDDAVRGSDHDAVLVGLELAPGN